MPIRTHFPSFWESVFEANAKRAAIYPGNDKLSLTFRGLELAGEVGELCNMIKKVERFRVGAAGKQLNLENAEDRVKILSEFGDSILCISLLAQACGISPGELDDATAMAFNDKSIALGLPVFLTVGGTVSEGGNES